jgi:hypothetical protein
VDEKNLLTNKILAINENQFYFVKNIEKINKYKKEFKLVHNMIILPTNFELIAKNEKNNKNLS